MSTQAVLLATGVPAGQATGLGYVESTGQTASATTKATASVLTASVNTFSTVASNGSVVLPPAATAPPCIAIYNGGANPLLVYANGTAETINALSAAASFSVTNGKSAIFIPGNQKWVANLSA